MIYIRSKLRGIYPLGNKRVFFLHPTAKLRVRHIERDVSVALPSAIRYGKELEDEKVLKSAVGNGVKDYMADRGAEEFLVLKKLFNVYSLFSCGLVEFLVREYIVKAIIIWTDGFSI